MKHCLDIKTMDAAREVTSCDAKEKEGHATRWRQQHQHEAFSLLLCIRTISSPTKTATDPFYLNHVSWGKCSRVGSFTSACPDISAPPAAHSHAFKRTVIPNQPWIKLSHGCLNKPDDESQLYRRGFAHTAVVIYEGPVPSFMNDTSDEHRQWVESWSLKVHQCCSWS